MIGIRLFAGLGQGRGSIIQMEPEGLRRAAGVMARLDIRPAEVNILPIKGFHQKPEMTKDGDAVSLLPAVGGG